MCCSGVMRRGGREEEKTRRWKIARATYFVLADDEN